MFSQNAMSTLSRKKAPSEATHIEEIANVLVLVICLVFEADLRIKQGTFPLTCFFLDNIPNDVYLIWPMAIYLRKRGEAHKQLITIIFLQRGVKSRIVQSGIILVRLAEGQHVLRALICSCQLYCSRMGEPVAVDI
jgi:hypothetical protein